MDNHNHIFQLNA